MFLKICCYCSAPLFFNNRNTEQAISFTAVEHKLKGLLERFRDLIITDSTVVCLHAMLRDQFPGVRTNHSSASLKMHTILSVASNGPSSIKVTAGNKADVKVFNVGD